MKLNCTYEVINWQVEQGVRVKKYTCKVTNARIIEPTEIEGFVGRHIRGKTNDDVEALCFTNLVVEHFPKSVMLIFPNLTDMSIHNCGLKQITKEDLVGYGKLEFLSLWGNRIKTLEEDLLIKTPKLRSISFASNLIKNIPSKFMEPVNGSLESANFRGNKRLHCYFDKMSLGTMMMQVIEQTNENVEKRQKIDDLTKKVESQSKKFGALFDEMFASGQFTDTTIMIHGKEQKVHKCILAAQSSVFAEMFTKGNDDKVHDIKKVPEFGEEIFKEFLRFFYTRSLQSEEHLKELFELAVEFDVPELEATCEEAILKSLGKANALEIFDFGVTHSDKLKRAAFDLLKEMHPEIPEFLYEAPEALHSFIKAKLHTDKKQ